jgi:tetratricopeptide (TPR) repeat protein
MLVNSTAIINLFVIRLAKLGSHSIKINRIGRSIMDLLHLQWKKYMGIAQRSALFLVITSLMACASVPESQAEKSPSETSQDVAVIEEKEPGVQQQEEVEDLPLTAELVYYILMAEIAGQRGEMGVAVDLYNKAAGEVDSPALAGRSAQVAVFTRDQQRISRALDRWVEVDPNDADIYVMQAPILLLQGDHQAAIKAIDAALELNPENSRDFLARIIENLMELLTAEQAFAIIQQLKQYQANDPEVLFAYARLAAFYKHYVEALEAVDAVLKQQAGREDALVLKSEVLQRLGKGDEALALLAKAVKREGASDDLRFSYAKSLGENGQTEESRQVFEQLHQKNPQSDEIIFALGLLALEDKDGETAKKYFSQLLKQGDRGKQAAYFMGLAEEVNGQIEQALIWFASVPVDSSRYQAAQARYIKLLAEQGDIEKAQNHLKLLRKENPDRAVQYFLFEASFLREQNQDQAAFDLFTEALTQYPDNVELLYGRAMVSEPLNRLSILEQDLRQVLDKDPDNAQALNALGYTLTDRTDRHQEALILIKKAVEISPEDPFYLDSLGWVYYRLGNLGVAERYLRQAADIQPDAEFLAHLGEVLWLLGRQSEAKQMWQQGLEQGKDNQLLLDTMRRFGQ